MATTRPRFDAAALGMLGMLTGAVAWALIVAGRAGSAQPDVPAQGLIHVWAPSLAPGLVYGVVVGAVLRRRGRLDGMGQLLYALAALAAYFCAYHIAFLAAITLGSERGGAAGLIIAGMLAGLVGSLLLGLATAPLLRVKLRAALARPVLVGTVAGALLPLVWIDEASGWWMLGILAFLALWQGAYAASHAAIFAPRGP